MRQFVPTALALLLASALPVTAQQAGAPDADLPAARSGRVPSSLRIAEEPAPPRKIVGEDDRTLVEAPTRYPFSAVGKLYATFVDGTVVEGSAVMVGPQHALTAAQVIHDPARGGDAVDVELVLALDAGDAPFGSAFGKRILTFPRFVKREDQRYDVALIELDVRAGDETGWLGLGVAGDSAFVDWPVNTAGYPLGLTPFDSMWYAGGAVDGVTDHELILGDSFDTTPGQDGSGVWRRDESDARFVVGVLHSDRDGPGVATHITHEIFGFLTAWLDGFEGPADLRPRDVSTDLPFESLPGQTGTVTCDVQNNGRRRATVTVDAYLDRAGDERALIGSGATDVRADAVVRVDIPVLVPASTATGGYDVVVVVNGDFGVPESSRDDNEARGPVVYVIPEPPNRIDWRLVPLPHKERDKLSPGRERRFEIDVAEAGRTLRVRLRGRRFRGEAVLVGPDGTQRRLRTRGAKNASVDDAATGIWRILVTNPATAPKARSFRLKAKLR